MPKLTSRLPPSLPAVPVNTKLTKPAPAIKASVQRTPVASKSKFVDGTRKPAPKATEPLAAVFRQAGLSEQVLDIQRIRALCAPDILAALTPKQDFRGETLGRAIFQNFAPKPGELGMVLVGGEHFPAIATAAVAAGQKPFTTGALSPESLQRHVDTSKRGFQELLESILSVAQHYSAVTDPPISDVTHQPSAALPFVMISDFHGAEYDLKLPSAADLQRSGVRSIKVFLENDSEGPVTVEELARSFSGKSKLAAVLQTYQAAGIEVNGVGLETWDLYVTRPDSLGVLRTPEELASSAPLPPPISKSPMFLQLAREQRIIATASMPFGDPVVWLSNQLRNIELHTEKLGIDFTHEAERYRQAIKEVEAERVH